MTASCAKDTVPALDFFLPNASIKGLAPVGQGNINETWRITLANGRRLILQRLHPVVFTDPAMVMANVRLITDHLNKRPEPGASFFRLVASPEGQDYFLDPDGHCWRLLTHIDNTRTLDRLENPAQAKEIGRLLGRFHLLTADIPPDALADPLPNFHITPRYLARFDKTCAAGCRAGMTSQEIFCFDQIEELRPIAPILEQARDHLSRRVIHGDPKAANFLFAADLDRVVSLIDFDTVKPGLLLHDLGDCLRSCCNPGGENQANPAATVFDPDFFQALLGGYLGQAGHLLIPADKNLLLAAASLLSFELALRFFTDHLSGDQYFKVSHPGQNLHRALIQFHLSRSIRAQHEELERRLALLLV